MMHWWGTDTMLAGLYLRAMSLPLPERAGRRQPGLDLLRAIAILWVMLYHATSHGIALPAIAEHGWMGVDLFFVLSGYLIGWQVLRTYAAGQRPDWHAFTLSRALRVLPAYLAVLALYAWVPVWREDAGMQPVWRFLTFTVNLFASARGGNAFSHAWSLCVEEHFYVVFPLVAALLAWRRSSGVAIATACALVGGGMLLRAWLWTHAVAPDGAADDIGTLMPRYVRAIYMPTWARLDGLVAGVLLAAMRAFRPAWWAAGLRHGPWLAIPAIVALGLAMRLAPLTLAGSVFQFPLVAFGCACLVPAALGTRGLANRTLPGMRALATLAFSLYLTHKAVYAAFDDALADETMPSWLRLAFYLLASLGVASILYMTVERPGLRWRDRLLARRRVRAGAGAGAGLPAASSIKVEVAGPAGIVGDPGA
jgi:peptidoglycan/LPS O-acetylase OafA/YrhL